MFFLSAHFLWTSPKADKSRFFYIAYSGALLILITIAMSCNLFFGQMMWIEHRDVDGGPVAFFDSNIAAWYNTFGTAADVTADILGEGLMVRSIIFFEVSLQLIIHSASSTESMCSGAVPASGLSSFLVSFFWPLHVCSLLLVV